MFQTRVFRSNVNLALALLSSACTVVGPGLGPSSSRTVNVDESNNGRTVDVPLGGSIAVSLEANPSTGYHWALTEISERQVLAEADHEFRPGRAAPGQVGVPGRDVWTFKAIGRGMSRLVLGYMPPGRVSEEAAKTFDIQVEVQ